ncbi:MAG: hypothetical protein ACKPE2_14900, partial [Dolichospermum sp.]
LRRFQCLGEAHGEPPFNVNDACISGKLVLSARDPDHTETTSCNRENSRGVLMLLLPIISAAGNTRGAHDVAMLTDEDVL